MLVAVWVLMIIGEMNSLIPVIPLCFVIGIFWLILSSSMCGGGNICWSLKCPVTWNMLLSFSVIGMGVLIAFIVW